VEIADGTDIELLAAETDDGEVTRRVLRWHSGIRDRDRLVGSDLEVAVVLSTYGGQVASDLDGFSGA
jgi:hypothetical protein